MEFPREADVFDGNTPQACSSEGDLNHQGHQESLGATILEVATPIEVYGHECEMRRGCSAQTSERTRVVIRVKTDQLTRLKTLVVRVARPIMSIPERSLKNGRLGPRGLEITKDEF